MTAADSSRENYARYFKRLDTLRFQVYDYICKEPGADDITIARGLHKDINSITPRVKEPNDCGLVFTERSVNIRGNTARRSFPRRV